MAKIRVCELAKDLNVSTKVLFDRLKSLHIEAKSHLSSLEDEDVVRVRDSFLGSQQPAEVNRPTVIRRRRERVEIEPAAETPESVEIQPSAPQFPETLESSETFAEKGPSDMEETPEPTEFIEPPAESVPSGESETVKTELSPEAPEKVIPEPIPPVPEKIPEEVPAESPAPPETAVSEESRPDHTADVAPPATEAEPVSPPPTAMEPEMKAEREPEPEAVTPSIEHLEPEADAVSATTRAEKPGKKKKKQKKDMPARIIALPPAAPEVPPSEEVPKETVSAEEPTPARGPDRMDTVDVRKPVGKPETSPEETTDTAAKDKKKKKSPKELEDEAEIRRLAKKKPGFRKKEVVEGADLYSESGRNRKQGKKGGKSKAAPVPQKPVPTVPKAIKRRIRIDETIVLSDLAKRMGIKASDIIVKLMGMGVMATVNQSLDFDTAALVAAEFSYEVERASFEEDTLIRVEEGDPSKMIGRPPVVTIMGHVDHGKTSLLDVIRKTRVTEGEAGGITQHIGAYHVTTDRGHIVFLDTPGHEAFTAMRSRGAGITDLVVLVVAADDGVMPQTLEAINHSRAANVPIIVAVNKMDKPGAEPDRILRELADAGLVPEDWGGDTMCVRVSAKAKTGIDDLLDRILLQAEIMELKADPDRLAFGHVVEAKLDSGRGPVATVLVQQGTLKTGDPIVCGIHYGKVRSLLDDRGVQVESAGPSMPVEVIGLSGIPIAGDELIALSDEKDARNVSMHRFQKQRAKELAKTNRLSLDKLFEKMKEGEVKDLNIIIKADVQGSIEALSDSLVKLSNEEVNINIVHAGAGAITESDVSLAAVSNAIIIGFNVRPTAKVQTMAADEHVDMRFYNIIYNVIKDVKDAIVGMMKSTFEERILGRAEVREVYNIPKIGTIAGCYVLDGKIQRGRSVRVVRDGIVAFEGKIGSLKRFKDDAREVAAGYECGVGIENFNDIKQNDILECFYLEELKPEME